MKSEATYYATLGASMCEQLGALKNSVYPRLLTQSLLSPTSSASDLRVYYNKLVRTKEAAPQQIIPALTPPHSRSSSPTSTKSPPTLTSTSGEDDSLEERLSSILQECLVDIARVEVLNNIANIVFKHKRLPSLSPLPH